MRTTVQISISTLVLSLAVAIFSVVPNASAQEGETNETEPTAAQSQANKDGNYSYVAQPGCSLTLLSRRSLQIYDQSNAEVSLSEAQIIYAETNIVKELGPRFLELNETVSVDRGLVEKYASSSQTLSESTLSAWQAYVASVNFDLGSINPVGVSHEDEGIKSEDSQPNETPTVEEEGASSTEGGGSQPTNEEQSGSSFWVIVALGAAAVYLLYSRSNRIKPNTETSSNTKKSTKTAGRRKK